MLRLANGNVALLYGRCLVLFAAVAGCASPPAAPAPSAPSRLLGKSAPGFRRTTLDGGSFDGETAGRVRVVEFFAGYCAPCQRTLPALQRVARRWPELAVVGVSLDDERAAAARQVARHGLSFPVVHDGGRTLAGRFRVTELPAAFVIDRAGVVAWVAGPGTPEDGIERAVAALLRDDRSGR